MNMGYTLKSVKGLVSSFCLSLCLISAAGASPAQAANLDAGDLTKTEAHDPNSQISINYSSWTVILQGTVTRARISSRIPAQRAKPAWGTKVNLSNSSPSRLEASRVSYHKLDAEELDYVHTLRRGMEALPQAIAFRTLSRDEQLAYWLNLYNITVYEQVAKRYPIRKLKILRQGNRETPSMWDEKILKVNGVSMSLNELQYYIIQKGWPDPLVIYGLYQGTIGGPNLRRAAFTGKLVYQQLEDNAEEFINSLRGMRFWGKEAHVSVIYDWNRELFPDFDGDLRRHLRKYTNLRLTTRLDSSQKIKAKIYDWHVADVLNGGFSVPGGHVATNPAAFAVGAGLLGDIAMNTALIHDRLPNNAAIFLQEYVERNRKIKNTRITIEEIDKKDLKQKKK